MRNECQNCKHHYPVPCLLQEDDPECPYVRCAMDGKVKPKWSGDDCEDYQEQEASDDLLLYREVES